jgi:hypothetical protein
MTLRRVATIAASVVATIVAVASLLLIPLSLVVGHPQNAVVEAVLLVISVWYVARVMRADRRSRIAAEAALPPERRPQKRQPRQPITFQLRETLITFLVWAVVVFGFDALALGMDPLVNLGVTAFAAFMLATLTVSGRHMMFRLTADENSTSGVEAATRRREAGGGERD